LSPDYSYSAAGDGERSKIHDDGRFVLYHLFRSTAEDLKIHYSDDILMRLCFGESTPGVKGNRLFFNLPRSYDPDVEIIAPMRICFLEEGVHYLRRLQPTDACPPLEGICLWQKKPAVTITLCALRLFYT